MANVVISHPLANCCLPATNAVVDGTYDANYKVHPDDKVESKDTVEYFVRVTVGADSYRDSTPKSGDVSGNWTVAFPSLTPAVDVTVSAQLMKSESGHDTAVGNPFSVAHVTVPCTEPTNDPGDIFHQPAAAVKAKKESASIPYTPHRHVSVYWTYDSSVWENRILRAVAIVVRKVGRGTPEVCAVSDATAHDGVATAVIPIPRSASNTTYQYYFALFSRVDSMLLTRSPAVNHPAE